MLTLFPRYKHRPMGLGALLTNMLKAYMRVFEIICIMTVGLMHLEVPAIETPVHNVLNEINCRAVGFLEGSFATGKILVVGL